MAQIGCAVWRRGDVDGRPDKVIALISPEDGYAEDGGGDSQRVQWCASSVGWTGWCSLFADGRLDEATGF